MKVKAVVFANDSTEVTKKSFNMKSYNAVKVAERVIKDYKKATKDTKKGSISFIEVFIDGEYDDDKSYEVTVEADHMVEPHHWRQPKKKWPEGPVPYSESVTGPKPNEDEPEQKFTKKHPSRKPRRRTNTVTKAQLVRELIEANPGLTQEDYVSLILEKEIIEKKGQATNYVRNILK